MYGKCGCKGCTERYLGCHDKCEKYKNYRKELDEKNANRAKFLAEDAPFQQAKSKCLLKKLKTKGRY
jgi:hypothetical protein